MIDLSNWKLTLPVDSKGGFNGSAKEVKELSEKFNYPPYFINKDGYISFECPVEGATTKGSKYPRCELRERKNNKDFYWKIKDTGFLSATVAITQLPKTNKGDFGRIVIGQIHGPDDELCRLYYDNGELYFYDDKAGSKKKETKFTLFDELGNPSRIPLNDPFVYIIEVDDNKLTVTADYKSVTYTASETISSFWKEKKLYFKSGVYCQVGKKGSKAGAIGSGVAAATFYQIRVSH